MAAREENQARLNELFRRVLSDFATGDPALDFLYLRALHEQGLVADVDFQRAFDLIGVAFERGEAADIRSRGDAATARTDLQAEQIKSDFIERWRQRQAAQQQGEADVEQLSNLAANASQPSASAPAVEQPDFSTTSPNAATGGAFGASGPTIGAEDGAADDTSGGPVGTAAADAVAGQAPVTTGAAGGGGGTGGGGTVGGSGADTTGTEAAGAGAGEAVQLPGDHTVYRVDGRDIWIGWEVPGADGAQIVYHVTSPELLSTLFPAGAPEFVEVTSDPSTQTWAADGTDPFAVFVGDSRGVAAVTNLSKHPFEAAEELWELRAQRIPKLYTNDFLMLLAEQQLEQMTPELFQERVLALPALQGMSETEANRTLAIFAMTDTEYEAGIGQERERVRNMLQQFGITTDVQTEGIIEYIAQRTFGQQGAWATDGYLESQVQVLAGIVPETRVPLDDGLQQVRDGVDLQSLPLQISQLRDEATTWLGPLAASLIPENELRSFAQQLADDPNSRAQWEDRLEAQALGMFQSYGNNPGIQYEDVVMPYRTLVQQTWGQQADEMDPFFLSLVQGNSIDDASRQLRRTGLDRGVERVTNTVLSELGRAAGNQVARTV